MMTADDAMTITATMAAAAAYTEVEGCVPATFVVLGGTALTGVSTEVAAFADINRASPKQYMFQSLDPMYIEPL